MKVRIAVPPGVGDVYWCLTKLRAWRERHGISHVELAVQRAGPGRSTLWADMVDFVDSSCFLPFTPTPQMLSTGVGQVAGADLAMWPNAIVDKGRPLADWLPELTLDLSFPVATQAFDAAAPRVLVYASSIAINRAWVPNLGAAYWLQLMAALKALFGQVTLIGAQWDGSFTAMLKTGRPRRVEFEDLTAQTTLPQVADLIRNARILIGVISGMTILANHFRTPTIAFCPMAHHPDFARAWVADDAPYVAIRAPDAPPADILAQHALWLARPKV